MDFEKIKKLTTISMFSDDVLMGLFVLKGGNAIVMLHKLTYRSSLDIDFSLEEDFKPEDLSDITLRIKSALMTTFEENGFRPFDITLKKRPQINSDDKYNFWGGYKLQFKLIEKEKYKEYENNIDKLRKYSTVVGPKQLRKFSVDISKFEYCQGKQEFDLDGFTVFGYALEMIVFEKLRAICQQMDEYKEIIPGVSSSARARDFFDIYTILDQHPMVFDSTENLKLITNIFDAKKVPLKLLGEIDRYREYHRFDFASLKDTVDPNIDFKDFDFYFDYVIKAILPLKSFWDK